MILDIGKKDKRNEADKKKRWGPKEISDEFVDKLRAATKVTFGEAVAAKMYSADPKDLLKCIKLFRAALDDEELVDPFVSVLDFVVKWAFIKSVKISNTTFLVELTGFFEALVAFLAERPYEFMEAEGTVFCLCLLDKIGMNNNVLRERVKALVLGVASSGLFAPKKVFALLVKELVSKNSKTVSECLDCIGKLIQTHQLEVLSDR